MLNPHLVRGLDYYTRTVFEFVTSSLGARDTLCAGGRYDDLVEQLGGPAIPAMGFAMGIERLLIVLNKNRIQFSSPLTSLVYVVTLGESSQSKGYQIAALFRSQGIKTWLDLSERSLSSQLKLADRKKVKWVVIVGEREVKENKFILRDMQSGEQKEVDWVKIKKFAKGHLKESV